MITRTRIYEYEPQALKRDKRRRFFARLRSFILRALAVLLIAAAVYMAITSLTPAHGETICEPSNPALCWDASPALPRAINLPIIAREAR